MDTFETPCRTEGSRTANFAHNREIYKYTGKHFAYRSPTTPNSLTSASQ